MTVSKDSKSQRTGWQAVKQRLIKPDRTGTTEMNGAAGGNRFRKIAAIVVAVVLIGLIAGIGGKQYVTANTVDYYNVLLNGKLVGTVDQPESVEAMLISKAAQVKKDHPNVNMVLDTGKVSYEAESGYKAVPETEATLAKLDGMLTSYATGVEVKVNDKVVGIVKDRETADRIMQKVKIKYTPNAKADSKSGKVTALSYAGTNDGTTERKVKTVEIVDKVTTSAVEIAPEKVMDESALLKKLLTGNATSAKYTVREGDCVGCIADDFNISRQIIYENNPWIVDDFIKVGDVLDLTVLKPGVTVRTVETVAEVMQTDPQVVVQKSANMRVGESKVLQEGSGGTKKLTYKLTKDNGYLMSEELIGYEILKKGTPKIVVKGTKVVLGEGTGTFAWPVSNYTMTSSFGERWGRMHQGIDLVGGSTIKAADDGVVEFAGEKNGYGKCIIINHKNGYKTLYGHLKSISVSVGDVVEKGSKIGVMGNTGRSTGTHLHFEIHKNGVEQNPLKYL